MYVTNVWHFFVESTHTFEVFSTITGNDFFQHFCKAKFPDRTVNSLCSQNAYIEQQMVIFE